MNYKIHIVSHSHWDREWYMSFEQHRNKLITLIDEVLEQIKTNPDFKSFHFDGHTLAIDDYLAVRSDKEAEVKKAISENKLVIGPMYVLNDSFLTSAEAQVRNLQIGSKNKFIKDHHPNIGYCPDTFGISSQQAQIFREFGIDNMFFGRGVNATGFNNQTSNDYESKYREMIIKAPDGSEVLGILFADWYNNGWELPSDPKVAKQFWNEKVELCSSTAKTKHLLFMNGCDHQPLQADITEAIKVASDLFPEWEFVHSSLETYLSELKTELDDDMNVIEGELKSQNTSGDGTLVNTASSRVNQKILNHQAQTILADYVEPLSLMFNDYDHNRIEFAWKKLLENHPHDSVCGCSCDAVHRAVDMRFEECIDFSKGIIDNVLTNYFSSGVNTLFDEPFVIINTSSVNKCEHQVELQLDKIYINDDIDNAFNKVNQFEQKNFIVTDGESELCTDIVYNGIKFGFELPKDGFRKRYYYHSYTVDFLNVVSPYSYKTFGLIEKKSKIELAQLENEYIIFNLSEDGNLSIKNKATGQTMNKTFEIYDEGDIGNEYMFGRVENDQKILFNLESSEVINLNTCAKVNAVYSAYIPKSADEALISEKLKLVEYNSRKTKRSDQLIEYKIYVEFKLNRSSKFVDINISFENMACDHRLRASFNLENEIKKINVDTVFDVVARPIQTPDTWTHYSSDHQFGKFLIANQNQCDFIVKTNGINEYEAKSNYFDITLIRSTSEMGDWGHFETPEAQMYNQTVEHNISIGLLESEQYSYNELNQINNKCISYQVKKGELDKERKLLDIHVSKNIIVSSLKKNEQNEDVLRIFAIGEGKVEYNGEMFTSNLTEIRQDKIEKCYLSNRKIKTIILK
ncbi:MAG: glycoside hydrolase family 38 C-terminal domain-containing protein [Bacilli bacterium]